MENFTMMAFPQIFAVLFFFIFWLLLSFGGLVLAIESSLNTIGKSLVFSLVVSAQLTSLIAVVLFVCSLINKMV